MKEFHKHIEWDMSEHEKFQEMNNKQQIMIDQLFLAVFGDKTVDEKGMKEQVDEIYLWLKTGKLGYAGLIRFFAFIASLSAAVSGILYLIKKLFK